MKTIAGYMADENTPVEKGKNIIYTYSENGIHKTIMRCKTIQRFDKPEKYTEMPDGLILEIYTEQGVLSSTMKANYAKMQDETEILEARFNVEVIDHLEHKKLNTEELIWDQKKSRIYSDKFVKITGPDKIIFGDGFESDEKFSDYFIRQPKGEILVTRKNQ